jgi:hypothetical protein
VQANNNANNNTGANECWANTQNRLLIGTSALTARGSEIGLVLGHVRRPQSQVVTQKLHDKGRVLVRIFIESVELGNSVVKGLLGELASSCVNGKGV